MSSKKKQHARRRAREDALSLLYSSDVMERDAVELVDEGLFPEDIELGDYAEMLVRGVVDHRAEIDERLAETSENWSVDRMPVVDRALLRVAVFEMIYVEDVPVSVAINEAVEIAKAYGGEDESSRFVNGVLGRIARSLGESDAAPAVEAASPATAKREPEGTEDDGTN